MCPRALLPRSREAVTRGRSAGGIGPGPVSPADGHRQHRKGAGNAAHLARWQEDPRCPRARRACGWQACLLTRAGLTVPVVALVAAVAVVVLLALTYHAPPIEGIDETVARRVADDLPAWVEWTARPFSWAGGWIGVVASGVVVGVMLLRRRDWIDLGLLIAVFAGGQLLANGLKPVFGRPRPDLGSAVALPHTDAFPSGHAAAGTACVGALAVLLTERIDSRAWRTSIWVAAVLLGLGIGLSRVALGVHWLSDVLGGWALGVAWLAVCLLARDAARGPRGRHRADRRASPDAPASPRPPRSPGQGARGRPC